PGDNFQRMFAVSGGAAIVSLPDFARGPGQNVDLTANSNLDVNWPVRVTGTNVQSIQFHLVYDSSLLTIVPDPAHITAVLPNWSVIVNQTTVSGTIVDLFVEAFTSNPANAFSGTNVNVVDIKATVPSSAPYGASQLLTMHGALVNEVAALNDNAIEKVYFPGDANGSGILPGSMPPSAYTGEDATIIAQVVAGIGGSTGFDATPLVDPAIVGDASGNGTLTAFDASLVAQEAAGINTPEVPDETPPGTGGTAPNDPALSIPDNFAAQVGKSVNVPVNITIEPTVVGITDATYTVTFDTNVLQFVGATYGNDFKASSGWIVNSSEPHSGTAQISLFNVTPSGNNGGQPQQLSQLVFNVLPTAALGSTPLDIAPVDPNEDGLTWTNNPSDNGSVLVVIGLRGDFNQDGHVNVADISAGQRALTDLSQYQTTYGLTAAQVQAIADVNQDGNVNNADIQSLMSLIANTGGVGTLSGNSVSSAPVVTVSVPPTFIAAAADEAATPSSVSSATPAGLSAPPAAVITSSSASVPDVTPIVVDSVTAFTAPAIADSTAAPSSQITVGAFSATSDALPTSIHGNPALPLAGSSSSSNQAPVVDNVYADLGRSVSDHSQGKHHHHDSAGAIDDYFEDLSHALLA
ncbi:MAG TPA: cohesin domain-containing protein, partial [Pirellulales bacterium]